MPSEKLLMMNWVLRKGLILVFDAGMAEQGCCQEQGQKCYTVYERKCRYANKPVCQTMTREFCENYPIKQCRYTRTPESRPIPVKDSRTKREKKCWDYEGHECATKQATHNETFT